MNFENCIKIHLIVEKNSNLQTEQLGIKVLEKD